MILPLQKVVRLDIYIIPIDDWIYIYVLHVLGLVSVKLKAYKFKQKWKLLLHMTKQL